MFIELISSKEGEKVSFLKENVISYREIGKEEAKQIKKVMIENDKELENLPNCFVETKGRDYFVTETYEQVKALLSA